MSNNQNAETSETEGDASRHTIREHQGEPEVNVPGGAPGNNPSWILILKWIAVAVMLLIGIVLLLGREIGLLGAKAFDVGLLIIAKALRRLEPLPEVFAKFLRTLHILLQYLP